MSLLYSIGGFILAIGVLVSFHEFGHYWVARRLGVKVLRFSVGFGKPIWSRRAGADQTEYVIAAIPLGGYVKMLDENEGDVAPEELDRAFNRKSLWRRALIVLAGPAFNFILAVALFFAINLYGINGLVPVVGEVEPDSMIGQAGVAEGDVLVEVDGREYVYWGQHDLYLFNQVLKQRPSRLRLQRPDGSDYQINLPLDRIEAARIGPRLVPRVLGLTRPLPPLPAAIGRVEAESPALAAGLQVGDRVVSINAVPVSEWRELAETIMQYPEQPIDLRVEREPLVIDIKVVPAAVEVEGRTIGRIGIAPEVPPIPESLRIRHRYPPLEALTKGADETWLMSILTLRMLGKMLTLEVSPKNISGPITIAQYAGESVRIGLVTFMSFLAIISISLGVINLLPIPMLDGGHLLFYMFEAVRGKPLSERFMVAGQQVGMVLLLGLMCLAFYNDIFRLLQ